MCWNEAMDAPQCPSTIGPTADIPAIATRLAPVLAALSEPNRLAILLAITQQARSVKELTAVVRLPQTLVSHHLKALREVGLVSVTAMGRSNIYAPCCGTLAEPARLLAALATQNPQQAA